MGKFSEYLAERKRGRRKGGKNNPFRSDDIEFLNGKTGRDIGSGSGASIMIGRERDRLVKAILAKDRKLLDGQLKSLRELQKIADTYDVEVPRRTRNWAKKEQDIADGVNEFVRSGAITVYSPDGKKSFRMKDNRFIVAETAGGGLDSDVRMTLVRTGKKFYVESKLNFETAEYFKFGLSVDGDRIRYDHSRFLQGLDPAADEKQIRRMNMFFKGSRNIEEFINVAVNCRAVRQTWRKFLDNLDAVRAFIRQSDEYRDFAEDLDIGRKFPEGFAKIARVFDLYSSFYTDRYNEIIDRMFGLVTDDGLAKRRRLFRIRSRRQDVTADNDPVFASVAELKAEAVGKVSDRAAFDEYAGQIELIEQKFVFMLETLRRKGRSVDFNCIPDMTNEEKLKYFFKMFISSTGRRTKDNVLQVLSRHDGFGNMQLCKQVTTDCGLTELVEHYYLDLHRCVYMQVGDIVFQFDRQLNLLGIPNLPLFKDIRPIYTVKLLISDDLTKIMLHVRARMRDRSALEGKTVVSFDRNDRNYICGSGVRAEIHTRAS